MTPNPEGKTAALSLDAESHKVSNNGKAEDNQEITTKRAELWFAGLNRGIVAGRLRAKAFGQNEPATDNYTPWEIQKNERIELAKSTP